MRFSFIYVELEVYLSYLSNIVNRKLIYRFGV